MRVIYISFYSLASTTRIDAVELDLKKIFIVMVVFLCFGSYSLPSNLVFKIKIGLNALTKLRSENLWKLRTEFDLMRLQLIICHKKGLLSSLFYKTHASTQQVLPVQIGLHRYDE